jgi:hypothetical protein
MKYYIIHEYSFLLCTTHILILVCVGRTENDQAIPAQASDIVAFGQVTTILRLPRTLHGKGLYFQNQLMVPRGQNK